MIQLPTVAQLAIHSFRALPATALSGYSNLIHLRLRDLTLSPPEVNQVIARCKIPTGIYVDERTYGLAALLNSTSLYADGPIIDFAGNNILEGLGLDVIVQEDASCRTDSKDWAAFDSVLTKSGAFHMLRRVLVVIWWYIPGRELSEQEVILDSLKEDKFPRLVESKTVEFNFSAESHWAW